MSTPYPNLNVPVSVPLTPASKYPVVETFVPIKGDPLTVILGERAVYTEEVLLNSSYDAIPTSYTVPNAKLPNL